MPFKMPLKPSPYFLANVDKVPCITKAHRYTIDIGQEKIHINTVMDGKIYSYPFKVIANVSNNYVTWGWYMDKHIAYKNGPVRDKLKKITNFTDQTDLFVQILKLCQSLPGAIYRIMTKDGYMLLYLIKD